MHHAGNGSSSGANAFQSAGNASSELGCTFTEINRDAYSATSRCNCFKILSVSLNLPPVFVASAEAVVPLPCLSFKRFKLASVFRTVATKSPPFPHISSSRLRRLLSSTPSLLWETDVSFVAILHRILKEAGATLAQSASACSGLVYLSFETWP